MWQEVQDDTCPGCNHRLSESVGEEHEYDFQGAAYVCEGCAAKERRLWNMTGPNPGVKVYAKREVGEHG